MTIGRLFAIPYSLTSRFPQSPQGDSIMDKETLETGLRIRTEVLGKEYVENSMKNADDFNRPFQEFVSEYCWGAGWGRPGLTKKERSMLNLAMIAILNRPHELKVH